MIQGKLFPGKVTQGICPRLIDRRLNVLAGKTVILILNTNNRGMKREALKTYFKVIVAFL